MGRDEWAQVLRELKDDTIWWKLAWWESEEIIYCCGNFPNVPLMGSRGCINYNPAIVHRQFAYTQDVPSEVAVRRINFYYDELQREEIIQEVRNAWTRVVRKGRVELGKRIVMATKEYRVWLKERTGGANPSFGPYNPLRASNLHEVDELLSKRLKDKKAELAKLEELSERHLEELAVSQEEEGRKRQKEAETSAELKRLKRENARLKGAMSEAQERAEESEAKARMHQAKLLRAVKEKDALEKKLEELQSPNDFQQQISELARQLEERSWELAMTKNDHAQMMKDLFEQLNRRAEQARYWETRHSEQVAEKEMWLERFKRMILFANSVIPDFVFALRQAEGQAIPSRTPAAMTDFFAVCHNLMEELKTLMTRR